MAASTMIRSRTRRCTMALEGCVQGVGFRPAIYRLAVQRQLGGSVRNTLQGVRVDVEGDEVAITLFLQDVARLVAAGGATTRPSVTWKKPRGLVRSFSIDVSLRDGIPTLLPVADRATC